MKKDHLFKPGESGNPDGRPKGSKDKRTAIRELLQPHAEDLIKKAVELAKAGDTTALRLCLDRLIAPIKGIEMPVFIEDLKGTLTEQGQKIINAAGESKITPGDAAKMLQALATQARIIEIDDLEKRITTLEKRNGS